MTELVIDVREKTLIELLVSENVPHTTRQLDLGDIQLCTGEEIVYVIERKTAADLMASLRDGRYREQKNRILENFKSEQVMYLIEGYWESGKDACAEGALNHMIIRDKIQVYHVPSVLDSCRLLMLLLKDWDEYRNAERAEYYVKGNLHAKKKDNMTPQRCFLTMLTCITGVSLNVAKAVTEKFPSFKALIGANPGDIYAIKINERRISKKVVEKLLAVLG